jgi:hypothetical protein
VNGPELTNWPQYNIANKTYAALDVNVTIETNLYEDRMDFWLNDIPKLLLPAQTTLLPITTESSTRTPHKHNGSQPCSSRIPIVFALLYVLVSRLVIF